MAPRTFEGARDGRGLKIAVVVSRFNLEITQAMLQAAQGRLRELGIAASDLDVFWVPGAFEIPATVKLLVESRRYHGILPLGCIIQGETAHFEQIARTVSDGLMKLSLECATPMVFGVLTTYTEAQARARIAKGAEVAESLVQLIQLSRQL